MEVMRLSYEKSINLLKAKGVEFEAGLTDVEMGKIESTYKIEFPKSLKIFLMTVLPVSNVPVLLCCNRNYRVTEKEKSLWPETQR